MNLMIAQATSENGRLDAAQQGLLKQKWDAAYELAAASPAKIR